MNKLIPQAVIASLILMLSMPFAHAAEESLEDMTRLLKLRLGTDQVDTPVPTGVEGVGACLKQRGILAVYGPFNYAGKFTSPSNARFDAFLKARDPTSGIKDFEWLDDLANKASLHLVEDVAMPENNRVLVWQKRTL